MDDIDKLLAILNYDRVLISKLYKDDVIPEHIALAIKVIQLLFSSEE